MSLHAHGQRPGSCPGHLKSCAPAPRVPRTPARLTTITDSIHRRRSDGDPPSMRKGKECAPEKAKELRELKTTDTPPGSGTQAAHTNSHRAPTPKIRKKPGGTHFFHTENEFLKRCEIAVGSMVSRAHQLVAIAAAVRDILRGWPSTMWRSAHRCAASMVDPCDCAPTFKNSDQECYARRAHAPLIVHHPDST